MAELKPPETVVVMVELPLLPCATETEVGEAERVKAGCLGGGAGECGDQAGVGAAPAGDEVVAGDGGVAAGGAAGDVVEVRMRRLEVYVLGVDGGVDEADEGLAVGGELLVDEGDVAGPHGRGEAGAAVFVGEAGGLVGAGVEGEVGVGGDVGAVAQGGGALVGGVDDAGELLPGGDGDVVGGDAAAGVGPRGFGRPGAGRAGGDEVGAADGDDVGVVGGPGFVCRCDQVELSPEAAKKFWPCAAIFWK